MKRFQLNINGDTYETIESQLITIDKHLRELRYAIQEAKPHGRNYQTNQDSGFDFSRDTEEHIEMLEACERIEQINRKAWRHLAYQKK